MQLLLPLLLVVAGLTFVYFGWRVYRFLTHVLGDASPRPSAAPGPPPRRQRSVREASRE
jgi:hypothetical protein